MLVTRSLDPSLDLLALHRQAPSRYPVLLESSAHGTAQGRWDMLFAAGGETLRLDRDGCVRDHCAAVAAAFAAAALVADGPG